MRQQIWVRQITLSAFAVLCLNSLAQDSPGVGAGYYSQTAQTVGIQSRQPKLLKSVNAIYPDTARESGTFCEVVIEIVINEQGHVSSTIVRSGIPSLNEAAVDAVRQWVFAPVLLGGRPTQEKATAVFVFSLFGTPHILDTLRTGEIVYVHTGPDSERDVLDQDGRFLGPGGIPLSPTEMRDIQERSRPFSYRFDISTTAIIPYAVVNESLQALEEAGVFNFRFESPEYRFRDPTFPPVITRTESHLFYSVQLKEESDLIQLVGSDPTVIPPKLDLDMSRLRGLLPETGSAPKVVFFTMFVNEKGAVLAVENPDQNAKAAVNMLKQVQVLVPGRRQGINVPTAVLIAIPTK